MLNLFAKLMKALNSETSPWSLAAAAALAMCAGFIPLLSLQVLIIVGIVFSLRVNGSLFLACWLFFTGTAYLLDPLFHSLGEWLLAHQGLSSFWQSYEQANWLWIFQLHHTIRLGATVVSLVLFVPAIFFFKWLVVHYRKDIQARVNKWPIMQVLKGTKFWRVYRSLSGLHARGQL
ncbi:MULTISPECIES: TIGR03546 family protein [Gammaproteobacteria]|uniref:TIGR03546 family protein n=1 Tax=Gammaproteobacteria TaxID=1236 RepID=UPI000DD0D098|nr:MULTISPECIES: TIGR03546 family protein [Gammaproteobacteria]RTE85572.1 TIGR03546 family protein [Aliidiomarina sp. B3213]TCZ89542.1 TIGR03546 family protein [Lysobacter sp. N42]